MTVETLAAGIRYSHDDPETSIRESILTLWETENWTKVKELQRVEGGSRVFTHKIFAER
jgi:hypothetical protein